MIKLILEFELIMSLSKAGIGYGYKAPSYHALRVNLLADAKNSISLLVDSYRSQWIDSGCTIMSYVWTVIRQRHLINFLVYCSKGISFIKSVDASDIENNAINLCNLFTEIAKMVGAKNVVQMVTNNAANYKATGKMLTNRYRHMVWFPCAAHCLNLVLKDISELDNVKDIISLASRPTLGYVYDGMFRARKGIKELFKRKKELYKPYTNIIDDRCDRTLRTSIHCVAYWLNPAFKYDRGNFCKKSKVFRGVLDMVEKYFPSDEIFEVTKFLGIYRDSEGEFSRISAVKGRSQHRSDEWWRLFAGKYPKIQEFDIKILSQTASSLGCERNWSVFERIHTKKRNRLEHKRLNDLVYVHYNLRLQNRLKVDKRSYDPIDYECIDDTDFWVVEEEPQGKLGYDQLKSMLGDQDEEPPSQTQENLSGYTLIDEDEHDSEFRLLIDNELDAYNTPMSP
nr:hypothetical protein [Tanacetum cinerariifolium]